MATQEQITKNIINDLRLREPSMSLIPGSPERRIIEAVAQAIAENQIDLNILNGGLDINAKVGSDLDNMLGLFGFGRQIGTKASGFLKLTRTTPTTLPTRIAAGTQFLAKAANNGSDVAFISNRSVVMPVGTTEIIVPVECLESGAKGNVPANSITSWNGSAIDGITGINNDAPIVGGTNRETDDELKTRFSTIGPFRNLAGTKDSYLSFALSTLSKKASVIGPVTKYTEYIQVPSNPDNISGNGNSDEYTTSLSTNVNAKYVYDNLPYHVSDDTTNQIVIYTQDADFVMNLNSVVKNRGDSYRDYVNGKNSNPASTSTPTIYQPNVTFDNVYTGSDTSIQTINPGDILFFEYSYLSNASRNDYLRGILNCVDIYVDNSDQVLSTNVIARPGNHVPIKTFNSDDSNSALYYKNFRRKEELQSPPVSGNIYTTVLNQPLSGLPESIATVNGTFLKNVHYWEIEDVTGLRGTVRARDGIEWAAKIRSKLPEDKPDGPYSGQYITDYGSASGQLILSVGSSSDFNSSGSITGNGAIVKFNENITLPDFGKIIIDNEEIFYQKTSVTPDANKNGWIQFVSTGNVDAIFGGSTTYSNQLYGTTTLNGALPATTTSEGATFNVTSGSVLPTPVGNNVFVILIDEELISYKANSLNVLTLKERGVNGTTIASHADGATVHSFVCYKDSAYKCIQSYTYNTGSDGSKPLPIAPDQDQAYWEKLGNRLLFKTRGSNSTTITSHLAKSTIETPWSAADQTLKIENYTYNGNIVTLQASIDDAKQITTDVLAHEAKLRYFKPDVTVMYDRGQTPSTVNDNIVASLRSYFDGQYFGTTIQLSDILQVIHNTSGVDNVRWSKDVLSGDIDENGYTRNRLTEVNKYGETMKVSLRQNTIGEGLAGGTVASSYLLFVSSTANNGTLRFLYGTKQIDVAFTTVAPLTATLINSALSSFASVTATDPTSSPTIDNPYTITFTEESDITSLSVIDPELIIETTTSFNTDFLTRDDELVSLPLLKTDSTDISPIITIRAKAQNTWNKT
jgi:uncharacterized phage protein gp47/JayE